MALYEIAVRNCKSGGSIYTGIPKLRGAHNNEHLYINRPCLYAWA